MVAAARPSGDGSALQPAAVGASIAAMGLFPAVPTLNAELAAWRRGHRLVAGVDEVGCGPLAGPVVAAAVVLNPSSPATWWSDLRDSKMLLEPDRDRLSRAIRASCAFGVGVASHEYIDAQGLTAARKHAMRLAIQALPERPDVLLIDAVRLPEYRHRALIHGDALSASIAAASIVAKVARDAMMVAYHPQYPAYAFDSNRGYATPEHRRALDEHGPCEIHRRLFAPVRASLEAHGLPVPITASVAQAAELAELEELAALA
jgi:ribonuclease HII